jgi:hypothetical protein
MANETHTNNARIVHVLALLKEELPKDVQGLAKALREAEVCFIPTVEARINAQTKLYEERLRLRHPKDKELTDWDRKIMLDAHTSEIQAEYELLASLEKALEQRISAI